MSSGPMIRQSALALVIATVARAYASSSWTICSSSGRARKYFLRPPVRNPTLVWARMHDCMGCHAGTGGDPSGDNGVLGFRDPVTGTEQIGHVVSIVQDSQARLGISMELTAFSQPFYNRTNVLDSMRVSTWDIPKNREEATSLRSLMGDELTEFPTCSIECDQLRVHQPLFDRWPVKPVRCWTAQDPTFGDQRLLPLQRKRWQAC